ncbi:MAG TPA: hypothetical protein HA327_04105 [Candidatus Poseidoniaceae archaeon]|nr:hypothetical protein [Candidatus Poseidoniaceae archaeon]
MRTCWVLDHPAHVRLLAPFLRCSNNNDVIIATKRKEVEQMIEQGDGHIPRRQIHWVERPVGDKKRRKALNRWRSSYRFLAQCCRTGQPISRIVVVGAALELLAWRSPLLKRTLRSITHRYYISDTEVNHVAHNLALKGATHIIVPSHWDSSIDGGFLSRAAANGIKINRLNGLHGHVHLSPGIHPNKVSEPPNVLVRLLKGGGIHDSNELLAIPDSAYDGLKITSASEDEYDGDVWLLDRELSRHDGVITQSVTLASEAALLGTPTLLVTKAKRGFINRLQEDGYPLFVWSEPCEGDGWQNMLAQFLAGMYLTDAIETEEWPDARSQLAGFLSMKLID